MERIPTGITSLDEILRGGFPEGSTVLIVGRPGSGKTIMAQQMMFHNASPDSKVVYLTTMAEPLVKVMKFQQEFSYFDLAKFQRTVIFHDLGSIMRRGGTAGALKEIEQLLQKYEPRLLVIDTIKTISDMIPGLTECRGFLLDLSLRLATWGCTSLLLGEYSEEDIEIRPESAIADGIVYLSGAEEKKKQKRYLRILKMRGTDYTGGENIFRISENGIEVFPRLNPYVTRKVYEQYGGRLTTGISGLDRMMSGGVPIGSVTLLSGASGTGKTIMALYFAQAGIESGENAVYVSFEENPQQIIRGARELGLNTDEYIKNGNLDLLYVSPIELDVDEHIFKIQQLVEKREARRLVIDSITSFEVGMTDKVKYTDHIWSMAEYFKSRGVTLLFTHEMRNSDLVNELTKHGISFVADNLLLLRYLEQGPKINRYLRVVKMRASKHDNTMRELLINSGGVSLGDILEY